MTVEEFKEMLVELNNQVVNFKAIEERRKAETSLRNVPSKLMENKNKLRGRFPDRNNGRYK